MTVCVCVALLSAMDFSGFPAAYIGMTPPPLVQAEPSAPLFSSSISHFGVTFDAGAPDGAGASVVVRPWSWLRLHGGVLTNVVSTGYRGGVTISPIYFLLSPTLTLEAGHFADGNANKLIGGVVGSSNFELSALDHAGYDFANAQLGIELGPPDHFTFFVRAGVSYLRASQEFQDGVQHVINATGGTAVAKHGGLIIPSVKLGLNLYLF